VLRAARRVYQGGHRRGAAASLHAPASLFDEFCTCFNDADTVIVAPVYAAGEAPIPGAAISRWSKASRRAAIARCMPLDKPEQLLNHWCAIW
jgi:UDP-N-acetylmuramate-alanine ligase